MVAGGKMDLVGLHCHIGTFILGPVAYASPRPRSSTSQTCSSTSWSEAGVLSIWGAAFTSRNSLKDTQYLSGDQVRLPSSATPTPSATSWPSSTARPSFPRWCWRPVAPVVDDAGYLVSSVIAGKRLPDGPARLVIDAGGVNLLFTAFWYKHEVLPAQATPGTQEPTVLYGPLCMNIDVLRDAVQLPPLKPASASCSERRRLQRHAVDAVHHPASCRGDGRTRWAGGDDSSG